MISFCESQYISDSILNLPLLAHLLISLCSSVKDKLHVRPKIIWTKRRKRNKITLVHYNSGIGLNLSYCKIYFLIIISIRKLYFSNLLIPKNWNDFSLDNNQQLVHFFFVMPQTTKFGKIFININNHLVMMLSN